MSQETLLHTALHTYIEPLERFYRQYEKYEADITTLEKVRETRPALNVLVASRDTCKDCLRHVPRMTRISEHLPDWGWEVISEEEAKADKTLNVVFIPTFILYDKETGEEIGRIVEHPQHGSLEADLLAIVST